MTLLLSILAGLLALPAFTHAVECLLGCRPLRSRASQPAPPFAVLIPAHDEGVGVTETIDRIHRQLRPGDRLMVVADNCTDDTAERARSAGAEVVERYDADLRGKGHALAFGRAALSDALPSAVIVVDADCWFDDGGLQRLAAESASESAVVQAQYLFVSDTTDNLMVQISNFALLVKNKVRQRGLARLGGPAVLQGTGMAFPWKAFEAASLSTDAIAEDLEIGIDLLRKGHDVRWFEGATVWSRPASREATLTQRMRWEHGFLTTSLPNVPRLMSGALRQGRPGLLWLAVDLMVPPLALLVLLLLAMFGLTGGLAVLSPINLPFRIIGAALAAVMVATLSAWVAEGRACLPFTSLLKVPLYIAWKLPIYARLLGRRQTQWVRTDRAE